MNIEIKEAKIENTELILNFMDAYYFYEGIKFVRDKSCEALIDIITKNDYGKLYLIIDEQKIIGYICITFGYSLEYLGRDCIIDEIYIIPEFQRKGIGSHILKLIEKQLIQIEIKAMHLEVFEKNKLAYNFFKKKWLYSSCVMFYDKEVVNEYARGYSR